MNQRLLIPDTVLLAIREINLRAEPYPDTGFPFMTHFLGKEESFRTHYVPNNMQNVPHLIMAIVFLLQGFSFALVMNKLKKPRSLLKATDG